LSLDDFAADLRRCAICHDQCMFATVEVFASGRQTLATSRKALLIEAVRHDRMSWTPRAVEVIYSGLSSGVQHATCVNRGDPAGWPDETHYIQAARAEIVAAGLAPAWALRLRDTWRDTGSPYPRGDEAEARPAALLFVFDAASRSFTPEAPSIWRAVTEAFGAEAGWLAAGSSGFELFDLGFVAAARESAGEMNSSILELAPQLIVCDSPEAAYMMRVVWPEWGIASTAPVQHASEWLAGKLEARGIELAPQGLPMTFHDPSCLARYLGVVDAPRAVCRRLGVELVEMLRHGVEAPPSGSYYGEAPGEWVRKIAAERVASAQAVGAQAIITASPFDFRNLRGYGLPVITLGERAVERLQ
jgi:hypothetical protein